MERTLVVVRLTLLGHPLCFGKEEKKRKKRGTNQTKRCERIIERLRGEGGGRDNERQRDMMSKQKRRSFAIKNADQTSPG